MTMAEKILASHLVNDGRGDDWVRPGDLCLVRVDGGYSHEFTTAQVHHFLQQEFGPGYRVVHPDKFAVFEDHLLYADGVQRMAPFADKIATLRRLQTEFMRHAGVRDYQARRDHLAPPEIPTSSRGRARIGSSGSKGRKRSIVSSRVQSA